MLAPPNLVVLSKTSAGVLLDANHIDRPCGALQHHATFQEPQSCEDWGTPDHWQHTEYPGASNSSNDKVLFVQVRTRKTRMVVCLEPKGYVALQRQLHAGESHCLPKGAGSGKLEQSSKGWQVLPHNSQPDNLQ